MMNYLRIYESKVGGWIDLHPMHGKDELSNNIEACRILADHGYTIELLPCIDKSKSLLRQKLLPDVFGYKNPDVRINGNWIGDVKTPDIITTVKRSTINRCIYAAAQQKVDIAIINLFERHYTVQEVKKGVIGALQPQRNKTIKSVFIITKQGNLFTVERDFVFDDTAYDILEHL